MFRQKLTIAIFHSGFIYSGGGERIVLEEAMGLAKRGYAVVVRAPTLNREKCYPGFILKVDLSPFLPRILPQFRIRYAVQMVATSLLAPILAFGYRDVDVFIGANQPGAWLAFCISRVLGKPYIVYMNQPNRFLYPREVDQETGWVNEPSYTLLARFLWWFRFFLKPLDHVSSSQAHLKLVNGSYIKGVIEGIYQMETVDCPAGAYPQPANLLLRRGQAFRGWVVVGRRRIQKPYVLLTNRHEPQKKFEYVIRAMGFVSKRFPRAKLIIPGPATAHTPVLRLLVRRLGLTRSVLFLGQVSEEELQRLYHHAAVYVYPSPQEDFGLGLLEAGAWGVPTVAWNNAGPTVTIEDGVTGFLATPFDISDYAEKIVWLLEDPKLRHEMGRAAYEKVRREFSWEKHIDILEAAVWKAYEVK